LADDVLSVWVKRGPGHDGVSETKLMLYDGGAPYASSVFVPPATWTRKELTADMTADADRASFRVYIDSDLGTQPLLLWHPQLESGIAASPYTANVATAGGIIASWPDQSGNGNDSTQSTQAQMSLVIMDLLDGYPGALWDNVDDVLELTSQLSMSGAFTVWAVFSYNKGGTAGVVTSSTNEYLQLQSVGKIHVRDSGVGFVAASTDTFAVDTMQLSRVTRDGSDNLYAEKNGVDVTAGGSPSLSATITSDFIGGTDAAGAYSLQGSLVELAVTNTAPSVGEGASMNNYFATKYPSLGI
jgi:hypothetical protein